MSLKFASASISENGTVNGKKGDQKNEIRIQDPYEHSKGWRTFRHPDADIRKRIGVIARQIAENQHFGYGQSDRTSGYTACVKAGYDPQKVTTDCNLDCSELVRTSIACAERKQIQDFYTANEPAVLLSLGFQEITSGTMLHGDIKCTKTKGHTVVVTDPSIDLDAEQKETAKAYYKKYTGASCSIVAILKAIGETDTSLEKRKKIAKVNGISSYTGTATQNTQLCRLAKKGELIKA